MTTQTQVIRPTDLQEKLKAFQDTYLEELEYCNDYAYEDFLLVLEARDNQVEMLQEFVDEYADDLDACHPDAFDELYELGQALGLSM